MIKTLTLLNPTWSVVTSGTTCDDSFGHFEKGTAVVLISHLNNNGARRCQTLCGYAGEKAVAISASLEEVLLLYPLIQDWGHEFF